VFRSGDWYRPRCPVHRGTAAAKLWRRCRTSSRVGVARRGASTTGETGARIGRVKCIFCDREAPRGSLEHVFLAALGGRVATREATCVECNNAFSGLDTGDPDRHLAQCFELPRNLLSIWSGRGSPPPTIRHAGKFTDGTEFDLLPSGVPVLRPARVPDDAATQQTLQIQARDIGDAQRVAEILRARGTSHAVTSARRVSQRVPEFSVNLQFADQPCSKAAAKVALAGACLMYGNSTARTLIDVDLRGAVRFGSPGIEKFGGFDCTSPWPDEPELVAHRTTPDASPSGLEHTLLVGDVGGTAVAYVSFFSGVRFSFELGRPTGKPARGLAVDPISGGRFTLSATMPNARAHRSATYFQDNHAEIRAMVGGTITTLMQRWNDRARSERREELVAELSHALAAAENEVELESTVGAWLEKTATIERGDAWESELDPVEFSSW